MKMFISLMVWALVLCLVPMIAFAQDMSEVEFLTLVWEKIKLFGGLNFVAKVATITLLVVASMKVSMLRQLIWDKLPKGLKTYVPIALSFIAGLCEAFMNAGEEKFSWAIVVAYTFSGAGAIILHEVLDTVKEIPGLGNVYKMLIDLVMKILRAKNPQIEQK